MSKKKKIVLQNSGSGGLIYAPFRAISDGAHVSRHVNTRLTPRAAESLKGIFTALYDGHRKLQSGRHVDIPAHAVCWLLENIEYAGGQSEVIIRPPWREIQAGGHISRFLDIRLTRLAAENLKGIFIGLCDGHMRLSNGRHVTCPAHAVCWLLENIKTNDAVSAAS